MVVHFIDVFDLIVKGETDCRHKALLLGDHDLLVFGIDVVITEKMQKRMSYQEYNFAFKGMSVFLALLLCGGKVYQDVAVAKDFVSILISLVISCGRDL